LPLEAITEEQSKRSESQYFTNSVQSSAEKRGFGKNNPNSGTFGAI